LPNKYDDYPGVDTDPASSVSVPKVNDDIRHPKIAHSPAQCLRPSGVDRWSIAGTYCQFSLLALHFSRLL
jgi:hypothetical protein